MKYLICKEKNKGSKKICSGHDYFIDKSELKGGKLI